MNSFKLFFISLLFGANSAFIFHVDDDKTVTLMNHKYDDKCLRNVTVMEKVKEFQTLYEKVKSLSPSEANFIKRRGFRANIAEICEMKRYNVRRMTDWIQPIADFCVPGKRTRKDLVLNTLVLFQTTLDFLCGMNQTQFDDIFQWQSPRCYMDNMQLLQICTKKSFNLYFWEKVPEKLPTMIQLINGLVCNFDYDKMLNCSSEVIRGSTSRSCSDGAIELLSYQLDVIKRNSMCYRLKEVSEIIESSTEDMSNIVL